MMIDPKINADDEDAPPSTASTNYEHAPQSQASASNTAYPSISDCVNKENNPPTNIDDNNESSYHLKWITWNSGKIPIVMQSINGPCPLIATMNVLLLREKVKMPPMLEQITASQLLTYLGECLTDSMPDEIRNNDYALLNFEQNIHDAIEILPKLKTGLDVNIRFGGITEFEYTPECIIFDILRIPLYHGWLSDPELNDMIGNQSYNQLVDSIITNKASHDQDVQAKVLIAEEFLAQTASQLTIFGLQELRHKIKDNEIGILFRNNHFLTLFKREGEIYTLVTDHGYLTEDNIIWETLDNIEGAGRFFDANFELAQVGVSGKQAAAMKNIDERQKQMLEDYLMALELEREDANRQRNSQAATNDHVAVSLEPVASMSQPGPEYLTSHENDFELAIRLQDEENRIYEEVLRERQTAGNDRGRSWALMERPQDVQSMQPVRRKVDQARSVSANDTIMEDNQPPERCQGDESFPPNPTSNSPSGALPGSSSLSSESQSNSEPSMAPDSSGDACNLSFCKQQSTLSPDHQSRVLRSQTLASQGVPDQPMDHQRMIPDEAESTGGRVVSSTIGHDCPTNPQTVTVTSTSTNVQMNRSQTSDRARQRTEKNQKETTCIVH